MNIEYLKSKKFVMTFISIILIAAFICAIYLSPISKRGLFPEKIKTDFEEYSVRVGDNLKIPAIGTYKDGTKTEIKALKLKSSNPDVVEIKDGNILVGKKEGKAKIICSYFGKKTEAEIKVVGVEKAITVTKEFKKKLEKVFFKTVQNPQLYGVSDGKSIFLNWKKDSAAKIYSLYVSRNNKDFKKVSENSNKFEYEDIKASKGKNYYKLKASDKNGTDRWSKVISVKKEEAHIFNKDSDNDGDGLSNEEEIIYGTDINKKDSNADGINDKEAVKEKKYGYNDSSSTTNKEIILDGKGLKVIEEKDGSFKADNKNVAVSTNKNKADWVDIKEITDDRYQNISGTKGSIYNIKTNNSKNPKGTITLPYNKNDLGMTKEKDLRIYKVNTKKSKLILIDGVELDLKNKTVKTEVELLGNFVIGDVKLFGKETPEGSLNGYQIIFALDVSTKGKNKDIDNRKKYVDYFFKRIDQLNKRSENPAKYGLISFSSEATLKEDLTTDGKKLLDTLSKEIPIKGKSNIYEAMALSKESFKNDALKKIVIMVTEGNDESGKSKDEMDKMVESFKKEKIVTDTVALNNKSNKEFLSELASKTSGIFFQLKDNGTLVDNSIEESYNKIIKQIMINNKTEIPEEQLRNIFSKKYVGLDYKEALRLYAKTNGNLLTGNFVENKTDLNYNLNTIDIAFERTYNSDNSDEAGLLGKGWISNFETSSNMYVKHGIVSTSYGTLNMRLEPGLDQVVINNLRNGTEISYALDEDNNIIETPKIDGYVWQKVKIGEVEGYIAKKYMKEKLVEDAVEITYPTATKIVFYPKDEDDKDGRIEYESPVGVYDKLIKEDNSLYLVRKEGLIYIYETDNENKGKLVAIEDKNRNRLDLKYEDNKLINVTDKVGRSIKFTYNSDGLISEISDILCRKVKYEYDSNKFLTSVTDVNNCKTKYKYYTDGFGKDKLKEIIDQGNSAIIKNEYDVFGRLAIQYKNGSACFHMYKDIYVNEDGSYIGENKDSIRYFIDENGYESKVKFNPLLNKPITSTDAKGNETKYKYLIDFDNNGNYSDITDLNTNPELIIKYFKRDKNTPLCKMEIDKNSHNTKIYVDENGNQEKIVYPNGEEVKIKYAADGEETSNYPDYTAYLRLYTVKEKVDRNGGKTVYKFISPNDSIIKSIEDPYGNITETEYYDYKNKENRVLFNLPKIIKVHKKDKEGKIINDFSVTKYEYNDKFNNLTKTTDALGNSMKEVRDAAGRVIKTIDKNGNTSCIMYDNLDRIIKKEDENGKISKTVYNDVKRIRTEIDRNNNRTIYYYDAEGQVVKLKNNIGLEQRYYYDSIGHLIAKKDELGRNTVYRYDQTGNLVQQKDAEDNTTTYDYDPQGNLLKITDPLGKVTKFKYDNMNRKIEKIIPYKDLKADGSSVSKEKKISYSYNSQDIIISVKNSATSRFMKYEYDVLGRITKEVDGAGLTDKNGKSIEKLTTIEYDIDKLYEKGRTLNVEKNIMKDPMDNESVTVLDAMGNKLKDVQKDGSKINYKYDKMGRLIKEMDPEGNKTLYTYDALGRNTKIIDSTGKSVKIIYEPEGNMVCYIDANRNKTRYYYNSLYNLVKEIDAIGGKTSYTYDAAGNMLSTTDSWNNTTKYKYDGLNRIKSIKDPMGNDINYTYDWNGNILSESDRRNSSIKTQYSYDDLYRLTGVKNKDSGTEFYRYDAMNNMLSSTDPMGNTEMYDYDVFDRKIKTTMPGDSTIGTNWEKYSYDSLDRVKKQEDLNGKIQNLKYDSMDRILSINTKNSDSSEKITKEYSYDKNGNVIKEIDGNKNETEMTYTPRNELQKKISIVNKKEHITTYKYDGNGNLICEKDYLGNKNKYVFDSLNRQVKRINPYGVVIEETKYYPRKSLIKTIDAEKNGIATFYNKNFLPVKKISPDGNVTKTNYDAEDNIISSIDGNNNQTKYEYDNMNRITKAINAKNETTEYIYNLNGSKTEQKDGNGNTRYFEYNARNLLKRSIDPGGREDKGDKYVYTPGKSESYSYTENGLMSKKIDRNGQLTEYMYDIFDRLTSEKATDNKISYKYDANNNLTIMTDGTGKTKRKYDELNRVIEKDVPIIGKSVYKYDITKGIPSGNSIEKTIDPENNITTKEYDKAGRLFNVDDGKNNAEYTYNLDGSVKSKNLSNGMKTNYSYSKDNNLIKLENKKGFSSLETYYYKYDNASNLVQKHDSKGITKYSYDSLNRLETVKEPKHKFTQYTYDKAGSRLTETVNGKKSTYSYDDRNRLTKVKEPGNNKIEFKYDNNGNQLKSTKTNGKNKEIELLKNTYDEFNQLIISKSGDTKVKNTYNGYGLRVAKSVDDKTQNYLYEYDRIILETDKDGNQTARNIYGLSLESRTEGKNTYNYLYNGHGDVTKVTNNRGKIKASYYYDSFGNVTEEKGSLKNPYKYAGYQYDSETELYYLNARMYDPSTARFLQEDTYLGEQNDPLSLNLYTYCMNNPLKYKDPSGHSIAIAIPITIIALSVTAVVTADMIRQNPYMVDDALEAGATGVDKVKSGIDNVRSVIDKVMSSGDYQSGAKPTTIPKPEPTPNVKSQSDSNLINDSKLGTTDSAYAIDSTGIGAAVTGLPSDKLSYVENDNSKIKKNTNSASQNNDWSLENEDALKITPMERPDKTILDFPLPEIDGPQIIIDAFPTLDGFLKKGILDEPLPDIEIPDIIVDKFPPIEEFFKKGILEDPLVEENGLQILEVRDNTGVNGKKLLPDEGKIGSYKKLVDDGVVGDNITPHHMPSNKYMSEYGISKNDGLSINVEQPRVGGRHRQTSTYGRNMNDAQKSAYYAKNPRSALAHDINDLRNIYKSDGLYKQMLPSLRQYAKEYIKKYPNIFQK